MSTINPMSVFNGSSHKDSSYSVCRLLNRIGNSVPLYPNHPTHSPRQVKILSALRNENQHATVQPPFLDLPPH